MSFLNVLFGFSGRITRSQYWLGALVPTLILTIMAASVFSTVAHMFTSGQSSPLELISALGKLFLPIAVSVLLCCWITAALYTKRLHDRGKGAVWLLAIYIPGFLPMMSLFYFPKGFALVGVISMVSALWAFIELGCMGSKEGPNQFDHDLRGGTREPVVVGSWDKPASDGSQAPSLGGMAAAMAAINAAARDNQNQGGTTTKQPTSSPQFGHQKPTQFGRLAAGGAPSGFGRRGM